MRDAIVVLLPFPVVRGEAGNDTGHIFFSPSSSSLVHTIYYVEKEPTTFNNERRRPQHLLLRDGVHLT